MSRLADAFARVRASGQPGLVTYVTAGDPSLEKTEGILRALDRGGADVLEVGVPFSDPLADGPVIQRATERALAAGATLSNVLDLIERLRTERFDIVNHDVGNASGTAALRVPGPIVGLLMAAA